MTIGLDTPLDTTVEESNEDALIVRVTFTSSSAISIAADLVVTLDLQGMLRDRAIASLPNFNPLIFLGGASSESDYTFTSTLVTFEAATGPILNRLHIVTRIVDDNSFEGFETVEVSVASTNHDVTIAEGDVVIFTITDREG